MANKTLFANAVAIASQLPSARVGMPCSEPADSQSHIGGNAALMGQYLAQTGTAQVAIVLCLER